MQRFALHEAIMTVSKRARITREQIEQAQARLLALAKRQSEPVDFSKQEAIAFLLPLLKQCGHHSPQAALDALNGEELDYTLATLKSCKARAMKGVGEDNRKAVKPLRSNGGKGGNDGGPAPKPPAVPPAVASQPDVGVPPRPVALRSTSSTFAVTPD